MGYVRRIVGDPKEVIVLLRTSLLYKRVYKKTTRRMISSRTAHKWKRTSEDSPRVEIGGNGVHKIGFLILPSLRTVKIQTKYFVVSEMTEREE